MVDLMRILSLAKKMMGEDDFAALKKQADDELMAEAAKLDLAKKELLEKALDDRKRVRGLHVQQNLYTQQNPTNTTTIGTATQAATHKPKPFVVSSTMVNLDRSVSDWTQRYIGLTTQRLFLLQYDGTQHFFDEAIHPNVLDQVCIWLNDPKLMRYSENLSACGANNPETQKLYMWTNFGGGDALKRKAWPRYYFIFQCDRERQVIDALIGTITVRYPSDYIADIGIMLSNEGQGHGYAAEAMTAVINEYRRLGVLHFQIGTDLRNEAMIRLATTCGLKEYRRDDTHVYMKMRIPPQSGPKNGERMWVNMNLAYGHKRWWHHNG